MKKPNISSLVRGVRVSQVSALLLGLFLLFHGLYHASEFLGNDFFSDDILEPISILVILVFSIYVSKYVFVPRFHKIIHNGKVTLPKQTVPVKNASSVPIMAIPFLAVIPTAYLSSFFNNPGETFSLFGILVSALVFASMAIRNPAFREVHFQFAIIVLIWAAAEIPHNLDSLGVITLASSVTVLGTWVHFISMLFIGLFVCVRVIKVMLIPRRMLMLSKAKEA